MLFNKFSENVSEFGDSVFDNAINLKEIELKQTISTKFIGSET